MKNSVQNLINEIKSLRGETVSIFGQLTTLPSENRYMQVDIVEFLECLRGYESNLCMSRPDYARIEELRDELERVELEIDALKYDVEIGRLDLEQSDVEECYMEAMENLEAQRDELLSEIEAAEDDYIETEADNIDEYMEYLEGSYGLSEVRCGNTYNHNGNVDHDYYVHYYDCGDGHYYVKLAVHRYGDVRGNYTDEVLLQFNDEYEAYEVLSEAGYRFETVEVNGEEYTLDIRADYEDIEVFQDGEYICTIHGCFTAEEAAAEIRERVCNELYA